MSAPSYEEQREQIVSESRRQKRRALLLAIAAFVVIITVFIIVCKFWLNLIGFSVVVLLILLGLTAKLGGQAVSNANQMEKHRLQLLDENAPSGGFKWK